MRAARWLLVIAVAIASLVAAVPINGSNINQSGESASCGPALGVVAGWTGPADPARPIPVSPIRVRPAGSGAGLGLENDVFVSARAWCEFEAGRWVRPGVVVTAGLLVLAASFAIGGRLATPRRRAGQPLLVAEPH